MGSRPIKRTALLTFLFLILIAGGCASNDVSESEDELTDYSFLPPDEKRIFLAYYPDMTPRQREILLRRTASPFQHLRAWKLHTKFFKKHWDGRPKFTALKQNYQFQIQIRTERPEPIQSGTDVSLRAFLNYEDGRTIEVTDAVQWEAASSLARIEGNQLIFDCLSSPILVSVAFLGEYKSSREIEVRKPIEKLEVTIAPETLTSDDNGFARLNAEAVCKDGTRASVSCQGRWKSHSPDVEVSGCGHTQLLKSRSKQSASDSIFSTEISFKYGDQTLIQKFNLPNRR